MSVYVWYLQVSLTSRWLQQTAMVSMRVCLCVLERLSGRIWWWFSESFRLHVLNLISGCCCDCTLATMIGLTAVIWERNLHNGNYRSYTLPVLITSSNLPGGWRGEVYRTEQKKKKRQKALDFLQVLTCCNSWRKVRAERGRDTHSGGRKGEEGGREEGGWLERW